MTVTVRSSIDAKSVLKLRSHASDWTAKVSFTLLLIWVAALVLHTSDLLDWVLLLIR